MASGGGSLVWGYFTKDGNCCKCNICSAELNCSQGTTTNAIAHLRRKHAKQHNEMLELKRKKDGTVAEVKVKKERATGSPPLSESLSTALYPEEGSKHKINLSTKTVGETITVDVQPFSIVENEGFLNLRRPAGGGSLIWAYFTKDGNYCKCNICSVELNCSQGTTTNAIAHLRRKHTKQHDEMLEMKKKKKMEKAFEVKLKKEKVTGSPSLMASSAAAPYLEESCKHKLLTKAVAEMIAVDMQLFSIVEHKGFLSLLHRLDPQFKCPSKNAFSQTIIPCMYDEKVRCVQILLQEDSIPSMAFTTDIWTSRNHDSFIDLTGHYLSENFEQRSLLLDSLYFPGKHDHENILIKIDEILDKYNIDAQKMKLLVHVPCFGRSLQLAVNDAIDATPDLRENLSIGRDIVSHYNRTHKSTQNLHKNQKKLGLQLTNLVQAIDARWNSEYLKEKQLVDNQQPLELSIHETNCTTSRSAQEWDQVKQFVAVSEPFYLATVEASEDKYPMMSSIIPIINNLMQITEKQSESNTGTEDSRLYAKNLNIELKKHFPNKYLNSNYHLLSMLIDPRYKDLLIEGDREADSCRQKLADFTAELSSMSDSSISVRNATNSGLPESIPNVDSDPLWGPFEAAKRRKTERWQEEKNEIHDDIENEMKHYFKERLLHRKESPLVYWRNNLHRFLNLGKAAQVLLGIPGTSVPSERLWSDAGDVLTSRRQTLLPQNVRMLQYLKENL